jgi:hypothetical protein
MELSQIKSLGEIAGIGGIALGVVVLLIRPLIAAIAGLPKDARAGPVKLIAIGCFVIGALGIATWTISSRPESREVSTRGAQSPGVISGGDASINYGGSPGAQTGAPPADSPTGSAPSGTVRTEGDQSSGVLSGGKVGIEYSPASPAQSSPPATK